MQWPLASAEEHFDSEVAELVFQARSVCLNEASPHELGHCAPGLTFCYPEIPYEDCSELQDCSRAALVMDAL